jgi:tRNA A-37 threonylcarbamoyl transferase component Bud32
MTKMEINLKKSLSNIFRKTPIATTESEKINLRYISGPVAWTGFEFGNKAIHFFSDYHRSRLGNCEDSGLLCSNVKEYYSNSNCMTIDALTKYIFETSQIRNFKAEVFLERPYQSKKTKILNVKEKEEIGYLADIYNTYLDIFHSGKNYSNVTLHNMDIRQEKKEDKMKIIDLYTFIYSFIQNKIQSNNIDFLEDLVRLLYSGSFDIYKSKDYVQFLSQLISNLKKTEWENKSSSHKLFVKNLESNLNFVKKWNFGHKSQDDSFINYYISMIDSLKRKNITFQGRNITEYIIEFIESEKNKLLEMFQNMKEEDQRLTHLTKTLFLNLGAYTMDVAVLTKMFKRLEDSSQQIIITVAGDFHIENYIYFFENILKLKPLDKPTKNINIKYQKLQYLAENTDEPFFRCLDNRNFGNIFGKWIDTTILLQNIIPYTSEENPNKYRIQTFLNSGHFGDVYIGYNQDTGEKVAIKVLKISSNVDDIYRREVNCLNKILKICKDSDVICIQDNFIKNGKYYIITPYLENYISLDKFVRSPIAFNENDGIEITNKLLENIEKLKQIGIKHGDIQPNNIMIKVNETNIEYPIQIKLIDFGLCQEERRSEDQGTEETYDENERINDIQNLLKSRSKGLDEIIQKKIETGYEIYED